MGSQAHEREVVEESDLLQRVEGDMELLRQLMNMFARMAPQELGSIQDAIVHGQAGDVSRAAHRLRGSLTNFSATVASALAERLENDARHGDLSHASQDLQQLRTEVVRMQRALLRLCQRETARQRL